jgi:hypothetical protein
MTSRYVPLRNGNAYRDRLWQRAIVQSWAARLGHMDLTLLFNATMMETEPMPRQIAVEIVLPGLHRPLRTPAFEPGNTASALGVLDRWKVREEVAPHVAERAERLIDAIARAASS